MDDDDAAHNLNKMMINNLFIHHVLQKLMGSTDLQNLSLKLKTVFKDYTPHHYTFVFWRMVFRIFQMFLLHCGMPVMCLELQKVRHFRCLLLSSGTLFLFYKFIVCIREYSCDVQDKVYSQQSSLTGHQRIFRGDSICL